MKGIDAQPAGQLLDQGGDRPDGKTAGWAGTLPVLLLRAGGWQTSCA
jgi:hypothetical protein